MAKSVSKSTRKPRCRKQGQNAEVHKGVQEYRDVRSQVGMWNCRARATMQKGAWECPGAEEQRRNATGQKAMRKGRAAVMREVAMVQKAVQECRRQGCREEKAMQDCRHTSSNAKMQAQNPT